MKIAFAALRAGAVCLPALDNYHTLIMELAK